MHFWPLGVYHMTMSAGNVQVEQLVSPVAFSKRVFP
jgi:hypothetical protein